MPPPPRRHRDIVEQRALDAQAQFARAGHHRLPPVDLLIAALADRHELGILHYDHDYDPIAEKTDFEFDGVWLAPEAHSDGPSIGTNRAKVSPFTTPKCLQ